MTIAAKDKQPSKEALEISAGLYKAYLDDLGRLGGRHETVRAFYLTLISALFTYLGLASPTGALSDLQIATKLSVGVVGSLICLSWFLHMMSFGELFKAKLLALAELEDGLPLKPFKAEKKHLPQEPRTRTRITDVDQALAAIAGMLFIILLTSMVAPIPLLTPPGPAVLP